MKKIMLMSLMVSAFSWSGGTTHTGVIEKIYVNHGWTMVHLPSLLPAEKGSKNNPDSCENNYYYALHPDDKNYDALHSTLLSAQMGSKKVYFWVHGCGGQSGNYPKISSVFMLSN